MTLAAIGLGANLGDAEGTLRRAIDVLAGLSSAPVRASRLYHARAWGRTDQPDFINAVVIIETALPARALLDRLLAIERDFGRVRVDGDRWGPRTLDLDLLLHGDANIDEPGLRVPHPYLHERAFVVLPLAEIAPDVCIPGIGFVRGLVAAMAADGIEALP